MRQGGLCLLRILGSEALYGVCPLRIFAVFLQHEFKAKSRLTNMSSTGRILVDYRTCKIMTISIVITTTELIRANTLLLYYFQYLHIPLQHLAASIFSVVLFSAYITISTANVFR